ncbi:MAG: hypothetical protein LUG50_12620 [Planctomycetaceae bacterium]|nr:hypothetical protein [Planctomycetaceae bacterium]
MVPETISTTRSALRAASSSWVLNTTAIPFAARFPKMSITAVLLAASRSPVGSSARRIFGRFISARAIATRRISPPESWAGYIPARWDSPTSSRRNAVLPATLSSWGGEVEGQADVVEDGEVGEEALSLRHVADTAVAEERQFGILQGANIHPVHHDASAGRFEKAGDHGEKGGFAAAGTADHRHHFPTGDGEGGVGDSGEHGAAPVVFLGQVHDVEHGYSPLRMAR